MTLFQYQSQLQTLTITMMGKTITSLVFGEINCHPCKCEDLLAVDTNKTNEDNLMRKMQRQLDRYFARKLKTFDLPLQYTGTPFQMKVWKYLQSISYGQTMSYQTVANAIGHPRSARAVGTACKRNPIPILIPCHRVIRSTGEIGKYVGGTAWKSKLLMLENG